MTNGRLRIAMVGDFFHPVVGGVENHIYMLGAYLLKRGHKVIVITHSHPPDRVGIRHLIPGLKVYHIPLTTIASSATLPNFFTFLPYLRTILLRERIQLVHGHASLSSMAHEAILHAHHLGVRTVFTDHSLFGFDDAATILTNKLLLGVLKNVDAVICVSYTGRENTALRAELLQERWKSLNVIPSAIVTERFKPATPSSSSSAPRIVTIVVISRLAYRKGVDLLVAIAPRVCREFPNVRFVVGGDGPKLIELLQMREKHLLQDRITLLGSVRHTDVRDVLVQGSIYLNTSLTEAFGIGILEAACTGLYIVSTMVGGVPEALPREMISFAKPDEDDLFRALSEGISIVEANSHDPWRAHNRIKGMYDWADVAERTERVYRAAVESEFIGLWKRSVRTFEVGSIAGFVYIIILAVDCFFFKILEWTMLRNQVDYVEDDQT